MEASDAMQTYEILERTSRRMLAAARDSEWHLMVHLELDCVKLIEELPDDEVRQQLDDAQHRRRHEIICRILADDAEIRDLVAPWMMQAKQFLTSLALERKLKQSYSKNSAS